MKDNQKDTLNEIKAIAVLLLAISENAELTGETVSNLGSTIIEKCDKVLLEN